MVTPDDSMLSVDEVRRAAGLARLRLSDDQLHAMRDKLAAVLQHAARLDELDLAAVEPLVHVSDEHSRWDDDEPAPDADAAPTGSDDPSEWWRSNAPDAVGPFFRVPRVLGGGDSSGAKRPASDGAGA